MLEERIFTGGMDLDSDDRYVQQGDYRRALNIRNAKNSEESNNTLETVKGNTLVENRLPDGTNKCIGAYDEKIQKKVYYFNYNQPGTHGIYEYDYASGTVSTVLESSVLNFQEDSKILHVDVVDGLLLWTDAFNHPRRININRAKSGGYPAILTEQYINNIVQQPIQPPSVSYGSDPTFKQNNVREKQFQFRVQNIDWDDATSAWGHISKIALPELSDLFYKDKFTPPPVWDNFISVNVNTGDANVRRIAIAVREGNNGDFFLAKTIDKNKLGLADNTTYEYRFYNNSQLIPIDEQEQTRDQDFIPLTSNTQALIDEQRLTYMGVTEGYDNLTNFDVTAVPIKQFRAVSDGEINTFYVTNVATQQITLEVTPNSGSFIEGDVIHYELEILVGLLSGYSLSEEFVIEHTGSYTVQSGNTFPDIFVAIAADLNGSTTLNGTTNGVSLTTVATYPSPTYGIEIITTITGNTGTLYPLLYFATWNSYYIRIGSKTLPSFKWGSQHPLGIVYYDYAGRKGKVQTNDALQSTYVPFPTEDGKAERAFIRMTINHTAPSWATHYAIVYAGNSLTESFVQYDVSTTAYDSTSNTTTIDLSPYPSDYLDNNKLATLDFTPQKGDVLRPLYTQPTTVKDQYNDFEVVSYDGTGPSMVVQGNANASVSNQDKVEIYSPKLIQEERIFFEIGDVYEIENGLHKGSLQDQTVSQPAIVDVESGDVYYKVRPLTSATCFVEDFSFSDFFTSNNWDKGRAEVEDENYRQLFKGGKALFTEIFSPENRLNGLSTVYVNSNRDYDDDYGAVKRIYSEGERVIIWKELKVGFVLINKELLFEDGLSPIGAVGKQNQTLSSLQYFAGEYGIGSLPESMAVYGKTYYWADPMRGAILTLGGNGINRISSSEGAQQDYFKMNNYFRDKFKKLSQFFDGDTPHVYGVYHRDSEEYVLAFENYGPTFRTKPPTYLSDGETLSFNDGKNRWVTFYSFLPDFMCSAGTGLVTWKDGELYLHETNDTYSNFYGQQYTAQVKAVFNQQPNYVKFYKNILVKATDKWLMIDGSNEYGQSTVLDQDGDFVDFEGVYKAAMLQDINTPNVVNPLIEGDDIRSHSFRGNFEYEGTTYSRLFSISARWESSEMNT